MLNLPGIAEELSDVSLAGWDHSMSAQMQESAETHDDEQLFAQFIHGEHPTDISEHKGDGELGAIGTEGTPPSREMPEREDNEVAGGTDAAQLHDAATTGDNGPTDYPRKRQRLDSPTSDMADQRIREPFATAWKWKVLTTTTCSAESTKCGRGRCSHRCTAVVPGACGGDRLPATVPTSGPPENGKGLRNRDPPPKRRAAIPPVARGGDRDAPQPAPGDEPAGGPAPG